MRHKWGITRVLAPESGSGFKYYQPLAWECKRCGLRKRCARGRIDRREYREAGGPWMEGPAGPCDPVDVYVEEEDDLA